MTSKVRTEIRIYSIMCQFVTGLFTIKLSIAYFRDFDFKGLYFGTSFHSTEDLARRLQEYEIVTPRVVTESGLFLSNRIQDTVGNERLYISFRAFGEEFHLDLRKNHKLVDSRFTSEILDSIYQPPRQNLTRNCYYIGIVRSRSQSSVALSGCHGLVRCDNYVSFVTPSV